MYLHHCIENLLGNNSTYSWIVYGAFIFLVTLIIYWLKRFILKKLLQRTEKSVYLWDDTFLQALSFPLDLFIWIYAAFSFFSYVLIDFKKLVWIETIPLTRNSVFILILVCFFWRYIIRIESRLTHRVDIPSQKPRIFLDATTVFVVGRFLRVVLICAGVLTLLEAFGIPLTGFLAFGGGSAIVMGIAAQQLLANWFGGLMIFLDKPFKLGDWIQSPDRAIEGIVKRIGWRTTEVMSFNNRPLYIPNALFNQIIIINPKRMTHRKIDVTLGIRYEDLSVLNSIIKSMKIMLEGHSKVSHREIQWVHFVNCGTSSLDVNVICFIDPTPDWRDTQQDILFKLLEIITQHKAQLAFPTVTTHITDDDSMRRDK
jgi:MscS family membrane protein